MGKLAERLADERRTGVYRVEVTDALEEAAGIVGLPIARVSLHDARAQRLLDVCAEAVKCGPTRDWDGFAAALADAAFTPPPGRVVLVECFDALLRLDPHALDRPIAALQSAAAQHCAHGRRFFAVFLDPDRRVMLDPLYDRRRHRAAAASEAAADNHGGDR
jgi:hypothetical protein